MVISGFGNSSVTGLAASISEGTGKLTIDNKK
jgi:hypothetical protein